VAVRWTVQMRTGKMLKVKAAEQREGEGEESQRIRVRKSTGERVQGVKTLYYQRVSVVMPFKVRFGRNVRSSFTLALRYTFCPSS
jgi:hypothetical protein